MHASLVQLNLSQVSVDLRLAPNVEAFPGALPCPTSYYLVPCVEWPLDGEPGACAM